jgi:hypothetical protein
VTYRRSYAEDPGLFDVVRKSAIRRTSWTSSICWSLRDVDVTICFTPDRLDVETEVGESDWPNDIAMARGPYVSEGVPFIVPRTAHH